MPSYQYPDQFSQINNSNFTYQLAVFFCRLLFTGIYKTEIAGLENIPRDRGFILACNHQSFLDPPIAGCFLHRPIAYFARDTLFKRGLISWLLKQLYAIPVKREAPNDVTAIKTVLKILKQGGGVVFFPEGTRANDQALQAPQKGIGWIACKSKISVLPVRVFGTGQGLSRNNQHFSWQTPLSIHYGHCLSFQDYDPGTTHPDRYQEASNRIMNAISKIPKPFDRPI